MFHVKHANGSKSTNPSSGAGSSVRTWSRPPRCPRSGPATSSIRRSSPPYSLTMQRATPSMSAAAPVFLAWCLRSWTPRPPRFTLVEANGKRCAFLREVADATGTAVSVIEGRLEAAEVQAVLTPAGTIVARACAPLVELLGLVFPVLKPHTYCIFPKGRRYRSELEEARRRWDFRADIVPSRTAAEARILRISDVERRRS